MNSGVARNTVKILASVALSLLAGYLAFRGVHLEELLVSLQQVDLLFVALILILIATAQILRSFRWGLLLEPIKPLRQRLLLPITCVGFLFIWVLPARLGEMARPYLLRQNSEVGLSAAMGSVVLERLIDASVLVVLMAICLPAVRLPGWILSSFQAFVFVLIASGLLLLLGSIPRFQGMFLQFLSRVAPEALVEFIKRLFETFYTGMQAVASIRRLLAIVILSLVIWGTTAAAYMVLFRSMDLQLGWLAAITVLVLTCIGISLPSAPGFIGNYHYACVVALTLFGVVKETALAFAIVNHFLTLAVIVLMGVYSMNMSKLKVGFSLRRQEFATEE
jgi:uncharacterized protein (TIRG00374 family)